MASIKPELTDKTCSTIGCNKKVTARGFCSACYYKKSRHNEFEKGSEGNRFKHRLSDIDINTMTASCLQCGKVKIYKRGENQYRCSVDANHRAKLYKRAYRQDKKDQLLDHCEICNVQENLCWDHSHVSGKFRGTLCSKCNAAIGLLQDDTLLLNKAIEYLSK